MKNYIAPGNMITVPAPTGGIASGEGALIGGLFGVAAFTAAEADPVELGMVGVYSLPKTGALAIGVGDKLYWDATAKVVNKTASGNSLIGVAVAAAANPSATVSVRLNGVSV